MTQRELSERARIGLRTVRELEAGRVRHPQEGTLDRIAEALRLGPHDRRALFGSYAAAADGSSFTNLAESAADIESVLEDKAWAEQGQRAVSLHLEAVVGGDGHQLQQTEQRVAEVTDASPRYRWTLYGSSVAMDVDRIKVTNSVGAEQDRRLVLQGADPTDAILALRWRLNGRLVTGNQWFHSLTLDFSDALLPGAKPDDFWLVGSRRSPSVLALVLRFPERVPSAVYEMYGASRTTVKRQREAEAQCSGVFTLIYRDCSPGLRGFEWKW